MKSLFARIFLWFWATTVLVVVCAMAITVAVAWSRFVSLASFNAPQFIESANHRLLEQGEPGLRRWLIRVVDEHGDLDVYLLDSGGNDMLGRHVPPRFRKGMAEDVTGSPSPVATRGIGEQGGLLFMRPRDHLLVARTLNGGRWRLIVGWFGASPVDVLGSGRVWLSLILSAFALSGAVCWLLARGISGPIILLQEHAKRLAKGEFEAAMGPELTRRRDEIGQLAAEFNQMAEQIRDQLASKEMLLRDISHELRSPLTRLRVAAGLARAKGGEVEVHIERIERDIERLDRLIDDTLRFSMVTTPGLAIVRDRIDLVELAGEAMRDAEIEAQAKSVRLLCPEGRPIPVAANADLLYRAIDNVLRNAIRHSPAGGTITIGFRLDQHHVTMDIGDEGPGVPEQDLERIFEAFYRVSPARERSTGGAGLGLALASRILAVHGGDIHARNGQSHGLIVTLALPLG